MEEMKMGRRNIGAIQDNRIKDKEFAQRILGLGLKARELGLKGKPKTVEELEERISTYLQFCFDAGLPPTVEGMSLSIDYDRRTVFDIENMRTKVQFADTIKRAKDFIANYDATLATSNKTNAAIYCFRAKNMYGMKDVQEIKASSDFTTDPRTPEDVVAALPDMDESKFIEIKTN